VLRMHQNPHSRSRRTPPRPHNICLSLERLSLLGSDITHPAAAANISCRLAPGTILVFVRYGQWKLYLLVNSEMQAEKASVNTSKIPIHVALDRCVCTLAVMWYSSQIGTINNAKIITVMMTMTSRSMRWRVKYTSAPVPSVLSWVSWSRVSHILRRIPRSMVKY
jgi:hypothetical protein